MIGLDTNLLIRYVTDDDAVQSPQAAEFIESELSAERPGFVSLVTLAELAWVLRSRHKATTPEVAVVVEELVSDTKFRFQDDRSVWLALELVDEGAPDFADALISAIGLRAGCRFTATFDRQAVKLTRMHAVGR